MLADAVALTILCLEAWGRRTGARSNPNSKRAGQFLTQFEICGTACGLGFGQNAGLLSGADH